MDGHAVAAASLHWEEREEKKSFEMQKKGIPASLGSEKGGEEKNFCY